MFSAKTYGQHVIKGHVKNEKNILFSDVPIIVRLGKKIVRTQLSDLSGGFKFDSLEIQNYNFTFSMLGYLPKDTVLVPGNESYATEIILYPASTQLGEVVISGKKKLIERQSDRIIFNVENSIAAAGSNALETVSKAPGIRIIKNEINLVGKSGIGVMLNGTLLALSGDDLTNFLKGISSEDISKIEVITTPSSEYDSEGSGLINIITKTSKKRGIYAQMSPRFQKSKYAMAGANGRISFNDKKFSLLSSVDVEKGSILETKDPLTIYPNQRWEEYSKSRDFSRKLGLRLESNFNFSNNTSVGGNINYLSSKPHSSATDDVFIKSKELIDSVLSTKSRSHSDKAHISGDFNFKHKFDSLGRQLTIGMSWLQRSDGYNNNFTTTHNEATNSLPYLISTNKTDTKENIRLFSLKMDLILPFRFVKVTTGIKLSRYQGINGASYSNNDYLVGNGNFNYHEAINAIYLNANKAFEKWTFQGGIRVELTKTNSLFASTSELTNRRYGNIFPAASIQLQQDEKNTLSFNYNRRIARPHYSFLNPFIIYSNPYTYEIGNPKLNPSYENSVELSHTYDNALTSTIGFDVSKNVFQLISLFDEQTNTQHTTFLNFLTTYKYRADVSWIFNSLDWLESNNQWATIYNYSHAKISEKKSLKGWDNSFTSDNQFTLQKSKGLMLSVLFSHQFPWVYDSYKISGYSTLDVGFKIQVFNKKGQVSIVGEDIFRSMGMTYTEKTDATKQETFFYSDNRRVRVSLRINLGKESVKQEHHESINSEETDRMMHR